MNIGRNRVQNTSIYGKTGNNFSANHKFVTKSGNDTTGNGSYSNPWLTIAKAIASVSAGNIVYIGDGVYSEDNGAGYFAFDTNYASETIFQSLSGSSDSVTIQGGSHASYNVWLGLSSICQNVTFKNITFKSRVSTNQFAIRLVRTNNIKFDGCKFTVLSSSSVINKALLLHETTGATVLNTSILDCEVNQVGADRAYGIELNACDSTTISNANVLTVDSAIITSASGHATNLNINDSTLENTGDRITVLLGADTVTGPSVTGSILDTTVIHSISQAGHATLIGAGCSNFSINGLTIPQTYDHALVIKECSGAEVQNCVLTEGSNGTSDALAFKAATNANAHHNTLNSSRLYSFRLYAGDTGNKCGNWQFQNNTINVSGTGNALNVGNDIHDSGGGVCDYNTYQNNSGLGIVRNDGDVQSLAELQAAWSDYDVTTNDNNSTVV